MFLTAATLLLFTFEATESAFVGHILGFADSLAKYWNFRQVTFVDLTEDIDAANEDVHTYLQRTPHIQILFLFSHGMVNASVKTFEDSSKAGAVILNTDNSSLLQTISKGLLGTLTWFVPANMYLSSINLRLDSQLYQFSIKNESILLYEQYAVKKGPKIRQTVGEWSLNSGLTVENNEMWERRDDLTNTTVIDTLLKVNLPKVLMITNINGTIYSSGYLPDLLKQLSETLRFKVVNVIPKNGQYGILDKNGSWDGIIGMLVRNEGDTCTMGLTISGDRTPVMGFTMPLFRQTLTLIMKKQGGSGVLNVLAYMMTFTIGPWCAIGLSMVSLGLGLLIVGKFQAKTINLLQAINVIFISLLQRDHHCNATIHSSKLLIFVICIHFYMVFFYYSSVLTSYMTVLEKPIEIKSFSDVLKYKYHVIAVKGTLYESMLLNAKPPSSLYEIYQEDMRHRPRSFLPMDDVINELNRNPKTVMFGAGGTVYMQNDMVVLPLAEAIYTYHGIGLAKDSEFTKMFNYHLLKMKQSGVMSRIHERWTSQKPTKDVLVGLEAETIVLDFDNLIFPSFVMTLGVGLAILFLILEVLCKKFVSAICQ